ncbi:MAG: divalent cation tolerance protein CutA, partial [Cyanobacteria bacterium J06648_11]
MSNLTAEQGNTAVQDNRGLLFENSKVRFRGCGFWEVQTMSGFLQVVTTVASREEGDRLAQVLVEERLAACVQVVGPIHSTYRWDGDVQ